MVAVGSRQEHGPSALPCAGSGAMLAALVLGMTWSPAGMQRLQPPLAGRMDVTSRDSPKSVSFATPVSKRGSACMRHVLDQQVRLAEFRAATAQPTVVAGGARAEMRS